MPARVVRGPDGRDWLVRSYRFERPPWRPLGFGGGLLDPDEGVLVYLPLVVVAIVLAPFTLVIAPLIVFVGEALARAAWALGSSRRLVEAVHEGPPRSRMRWTTDADHIDAVLDQVARQLELGYERIQPHQAAFRGFG